MEAIRLMGQVVDTTTALVNGTRADQYDNLTPCAGWTVRDLVNHITGGATMFAISAEQGSVPDEELGRLMGGDNLGDDPQTAWKIASERAMAAFGLPGVLERNATLPFGVMPVGVALNIAIFDVATHACDLAHATGQSITDGAMLEQALEIGRQMVGPELRAPGVFDAEVSCADDAPASQRLLAFAGRAL